ncbi:MAG: ABC transporter permease [Candidatus Anammoxibacter sp.]
MNTNYLIMQIINTQKAGKSVVDVIKHTNGAFQLFCDFVKNLTALQSVSIRAILYKQIYFTAIEPLSRIVVIGVFIGVIITQINSVVGLNAAIIGKLLVSTVVRELGPLLVAILIIARSCTATTAELGSMKIKKEIDNLKFMGINPVRYLVVPRIMGVTISMFVLTFYFQIATIVGGLALYSLFSNISFYKHINDIFLTLSFYDIGASLFKSAIFGIFISTIACYHGLRVHSSITEIPQTTIAAVMQSLFSIFIIDCIIAIILFL